MDEILSVVGWCLVISVAGAVLKWLRSRGPPMIMDG